MIMEKFVHLLQEKYFTLEEMEILIVPFGLLSQKDQKFVYEAFRKKPIFLYKISKMFQKQGRPLQETDALRMKQFLEQGGALMTSAQEIME
ncbi:MAG: hypothetical protein EOM19_02725 [Candidatus Moranbacteria bacterium]|nr:hypothetical protein [Candidatus Moranbacteria bacterium]